VFREMLPNLCSCSESLRKEGGRERKDFLCGECIKKPPSTASGEVSVPSKSSEPERTCVVLSSDEG
jgi:hypothetical protein